MVDVLVVDDNRDLAETLSQLLRLEGHDVRTVYDGAAAMREAAKVPPKVVVLDVGLPNVDGITVARHLRRTYDGVVLIMCTGYSDRATQRRVSEAGVDRVFIKPVEVSALLAAVRGV
jgi:DNA-binding response OmpR family regulator